MQGTVQRWTDRHRLLTVVLVATIIATPGYFRQEQAINKAQEAVDSVVEQRDTARVANCENQNVVYEKINRILRLASAPEEGETRTPQRQAEVDAALIPFLIPFNKCDLASIERDLEIRNSQQGV